MFNPTDLSLEIFGILRSFDYTVNIFDFDGNRVYEPGAARRFFATPKNITVSIFDDGENSCIKMFLSQSTSISEVTNLIDTMRTTASKFGVLFNVRKYERELKPKDLSPNTDLSYEPGISLIDKGKEKDFSDESEKIDNIKDEVGDLSKDFSKIIKHLKKKNEKVKESMENLNERRSEEMIELPALGCSVEMDAWTAFKGGHLKLFSPPESFDEASLPDDETAATIIKLRAVASNVAADGMANMLVRVADAIEHGNTSKLYMAIARRAIGLGYQADLHESISDFSYGNGMPDEIVSAAKLIYNSGFEPEIYSGRGMYGDQCLAVRVEYEHEIDEILKKTDLPDPSVDQMGKGYIAYWRYLKIPHRLDEKRTEMISLPALGDIEVSKEAWEDFKSGHLALNQPVDFSAELGTTANPAAFYLRQIAAVTSDDSMSNLFGKVADDLENNTVKGEIRNLCRAISNMAIASAKGNGHANLTEGLIVTESIREFGEWFDSLSSEKLFENDISPSEERMSDLLSNSDPLSGSYEDAVDLAYDTVYEEFTVGDFLDTAGDDFTYNDPTLPEEEKTVSSDTVRSSLIGYFRQKLEDVLDGNEYPSEKDVETLADTFLGEVKEAMEKDGWSVTDDLDECDELKSEDVLLPKNPKDDLTREVTAKHTDDDDENARRIVALARPETL